ncbi:sulfatase family protein [Clostridium grantii]|uniref:Arylsulfatase A n=1 Tax=Clostridium grantii DSM 8605 TaxID=1121316 RepID=A0A1M5U3P2_9CLOT|nr:sulfatase-like hydrolase/transferase [Clostridium grantii]SHH57486.1 Arylsulfatase A [Clostridium grantii DSM 8605]
MGKRGKIIKKRNIIVILCDQLRKDFLPIYGCEAIKTPNIDKLAHEGVIFDKCITQSPVCAPARATMMTGRYVSDHQVWTNDVPFRQGVEYLAEKMNDLGYVTGAFGKLHHTPGLDTKGFTHSSLMEENRLKNEDSYLKFLKEKDSTVKSVFNVNSKHQFKLDDNLYYEGFTANKALGFIDEHKEQPFFAWVSFQGPHTPYDPPKEWRGKVNVDKLPKPIIRPNKDLSENALYRSALRNISEDIKEIMDIREAYGEMIMEIDAQIGKILKYLEKENLLDNTTILFSSDHGDLLGDMDLNEKGPYLFEAQLGIPMILSNQPNVEKNKRSNLLVGNIDIPGTVLEIAGSIHGIGYSKSMLSLLNGNLSRNVNFSEFCDTIKIVEDGQYRYAYYPFDGYSELYDRDSDPNELNNLHGKDEYLNIENKFLKDILDFNIISHGIKIEAHDLVPSKKKGIENKYPNFLDDFPIAFPVNASEKMDKLAAKGLDTKFNEFCKGRSILVHYSANWKE